MLAEEMARYLTAQGLVTYGAKGNTFIDHLPNAPDTAIGIFHSGGSPPEHKNSIRYPRLQLLCRAKNRRDAQALADSLLTHLHSLRHVTLTTGGTTVLLISALQPEPIPLQDDENGRVRYSVNFELMTGGQ
jgi:hypothetical protein